MNILYRKYLWGAFSNHAGAGRKGLIGYSALGMSLCRLKMILVISFAPHCFFFFPPINNKIPIFMCNQELKIYIGLHNPKRIHLSSIYWFNMIIHTIHLWSIQWFNIIIYMIGMINLFIMIIHSIKYLFIKFKYLY